jgi:predicted dehydrogenase
MSKLRMAVIGVGHLGKEHARILSTLRGVELVGVADINPGQAQAVADRLQTQAYDDYWPLLNLVDAACVVVPTRHHFEVAREFLQRSIPVLVEKPLAPTLAEAEALVDLAERHRTVLQVGHIERFNTAYEELLRRPISPKFIQAERVGPFTGRSTDIGVVLDLMIHDLDLLLNLVKAPVRSVEAIGVSIFGEHEDVANTRLHFVNGCVAEVTASRASPTAARQTHIWAAEGYARVDYGKRQLTLVQPGEQIREQGLDPRQLDAVSQARLKEDWFTRHFQSLHLDCNNSDQLTRELEDFVRSVTTGQPPRVTGEDGLNAIALADRVLHSLRLHRWDGHSEGPTGPNHLPHRTGLLFQPRSGEAAA